MKNTFPYNKVRAPLFQGLSCRCGENTRRLHCLSASFWSKGFTLVELLVVIAIVCILAALLLPVVSSFQSRSYAAGCAGNMKQIMGVLHQYVNDNDGWLPWVPYGSSGSVGFGNPSSGTAPEQALAAGGYFNTCPDILRCPGWRDWGKNSPTPAAPYLSKPLTTPINNVRHTYNYFRFRGSSIPNEPNSSTPKLKLSSINEPSKQWYVCDSSFGWQYAPNDITFSVTRSHRDGGNAGFLDGHVEFIARSGWTTNNRYLNYPKQPPNSQFPNPD